MNISGCDLHPGWQQGAFLDTETSEVRKVSSAMGTEKPSVSIGSCRRQR